MLSPTPLTARAKTGIALIDDRLGGGFEKPSVLLFFSRTLAEKRLFAEHFLATGLKAGERCLYVDFYRETALSAADLGRFGVTDRSALTLVDAMSAQLLTPSSSEYAIADIGDLTHIVDVIRRAIRRTRPDRVVIDSLEFLADRFPREEVLRAWRALVEEAREAGASLAFLFINWTYGEVEVQRIHEMADYILDFETRTRAGVMQHFLRVTHQAPGGVRTAWIPFQFRDLVGVTVYFPRILVAGPFSSGKSTVVRALCSGSVSVDRMGTTVSFDYGHLQMMGLEADLIGTPGQERFEFMFRIFAKEVNGLLLVIDGSRPDDLVRARRILEVVGADVPRVVLANKSDLPNPMDDTTIREGLGVGEDVAIIRTVATDGKGIREGVMALVDRIMGV